jgi:hypothetical protein
MKHLMTSHITIRNVRILKKEYLIIHEESLLMTSSAVLPGPENTTDNPRNKKSEHNMKKN